MTNIIFRPTGRKLTSEFPHLGNFGGMTFRNPAYFVNQGMTQFVSKPAANISEDEKHFTIELAIPGLTKEDVQIEVNKNILTVSGNHTHDTETTYRLREFNFTQFKRTFRMPETADMDQIDAVFANGILRITVAKIQKPEPKKIEIS
jgi:HSP20 family protein